MGCVRSEPFIRICQAIALNLARIVMNTLMLKTFLNKMLSRLFWIMWNQLNLKFAMFICVSVCFCVSPQRKLFNSLEGRLLVKDSVIWEVGEVDFLSVCAMP